MAFPALWGMILPNSDGQKTTYNMSKFTICLEISSFTIIYIYGRIVEFMFT